MSHERYPLSERTKVIGRNPDWFALRGKENRMSVDKFVYGKVDEAHHDGKISELRRIAEAEQQMKDFQNGEVFMPQGQEVEVFPLETGQPYRGNGGLE